ncbi:MAG: hypothetical protein IJ068_00850 [Bacilli bacterium]|nr:hypothetical protein [Bacilli bacterium]
MKNTGNMLYDIKDLRIVMIDKDYIEYEKDDSVNYFNENVKFIVEKFLDNGKDKNGLPYFVEYYTECLTEEDLSERISHKPFKDEPKIFSLIETIPDEYLTEEELASGKISYKRIFKILQDINVNTKKGRKIKKIGKK